MSRIGKSPITVPSGVTVTIGTDDVQVKGPKGTLNQVNVEFVTVKQEDSQLVLERSGEHRTARSNHGLMRALLANMVTGVTDGFTKVLEVQGVGYRADVRGPKLVMNLGYSHPIEYAIPDGVAIEVDKQNNITVTGVDKALVGQTAANIRSFRAPDRYKGKGVRYRGERITLKAGKSA